MINLTRSQEREERGKMGRGMLVSAFGAIFCWVPILGLLLAAIGFTKVFVRFTAIHRSRRRAYLAATLIILILVTGAQMAEVYLYVENPNILSEAGMWIFTKLTGETQLPGSSPGNYDYYGGVDYGTGPGMGYDPALYDEDQRDEGVWYESEDFGEEGETE